MSRWADLAVGGWQLSSIFLWQGGPYLTPYFPGGSVDPSGTGSGLTGNSQGGAYPGRAQKPDRIGDTAHQVKRGVLDLYNQAPG